MEPILSLKNISLSYHTPQGETEAVKNVSFDVAKSEFVSIVGPSGCGKSSLLSAISGLIGPSSGEINVNCENGRLNCMGYMLQKDHLFEWRSIGSNILLGLEIQNKLTEENIAYANLLLKKYGLEDFRNHRPSQLSGGMRQRAALVRTMALKPDILLLDEPFSALDYQTRLSVSDEIGTIIRREGMTALLVTHDISEAVSLSDRVVVLSKRPSVVKNIHRIELGGESGSSEGRSPIKAREAPEFRHYFNAIWKELDINV